RAPARTRASVIARPSPIVLPAPLTRAIFPARGRSCIASPHGLELRQREVRGCDFPYHFDRHPDSHIFGVDVDHVAVHPPALVELDNGQDVGNVVGERWMRWLVKHGERVDTALATRFLPLEGSD